MYNRRFFLSNSVNSPDGLQFLLKKNKICFIYLLTSRNAAQEQWLCTYKVRSELIGYSREKLCVLILQWRSILKRATLILSWKYATTIPCRRHLWSKQKFLGPGYAGHFAEHGIRKAIYWVCNVHNNPVKQTCLICISRIIKNSNRTLVISKNTKKVKIMFYCS